MAGEKMIQWERHHGTSRVQVTKLIKLSILYKYYCGIAIGNNVGGLYGIKNSVSATLLYNCEIANKKERQQFCPCLRTSLCMWWSNKLILVKTNIERNYPSCWPLNLCWYQYLGISLRKRCYTNAYNKAINSVF